MIRCVKDLSPELEGRGGDPAPSVRGYRILGHSFEVRSNSPPLAGLCEQVYGGFITDRLYGPASVLYLLEDPEDRETPYRTVDPGSDSFLCSEVGQAVSFLGAQLTCNHLYRLPFLFIHAAVLARKGRGLIFAGPSGAGKTTFILTLAGESYTFLSDEFAPFSLEGGGVHPFPRALLLDREALPRIPVPASLPHFLDYGEKRPAGSDPPRRYILAPGKAFSAVGDSPVPPAAVFILDGFSPTTTAARALPAARALELLLKAAVNPAFLDHTAAESAVGMLIATLSRVPAFLLRPGPAGEDPAARAGLLEELAAAGPSETEDLEAIGEKCREILKRGSGVPA